MLFSTETRSVVSGLGVFNGVRLLLESGFTALDFSFVGDQPYVFGDDWSMNARALRLLAAEYGVSFDQAHAPCGGYIEAFMQNHFPKFPRAFEFASALGVRTIVVHPIRPLPLYYGNEQAYFDANLEFYSSLIPMARDNGLRVAIENQYGNHPITKRLVNDICGDPDELSRMYDTLAAPDVFTVCLDMGHAALCGFEPEDAVRVVSGDRLGAIHVHDVDYIHDMHTLPGLGKINWDKVCRALAQIDYKGTFTLEAYKFLSGYDTAYYPSAVKFMSDTAKYLADKVDSYRTK